MQFFTEVPSRYVGDLLQLFSSSSSLPCPRHPAILLFVSISPPYLPFHLFQCIDQILCTLATLFDLFFTWLSSSGAYLLFCTCSQDDGWFILSVEMKGGFEMPDGCFFEETTKDQPYMSLFLTNGLGAWRLPLTARGGL